MFHTIYSYFIKSDTFYIYENQTNLYISDLILQNTLNERNYPQDPSLEAHRPLRAFDGPFGHLHLLFHRHSGLLAVDVDPHHSNGQNKPPRLCHVGLAHPAPLLQRHPDRTRPRAKGLGAQR